MWILLGLLMPLPFLPIFLLVEAGLRGYLLPRMRLLLTPRKAVLAVAALPCVVSLPLLGMGHLHGGGGTYPGAPGTGLLAGLKWHRTS